MDNIFPNIALSATCVILLWKPDYSAFLSYRNIDCGTFKLGCTLIAYRSELNNAEHSDSFTRLDFIRAIYNISSVKIHQTLQLQLGTTPECWI